jgi:DNA-binding PadR family transcriptional regulator
MAAPPVTGPVLDVLALLLHALDQNEELSGWQIMKGIRRSGPTVYAVLDRLEDAGWVNGQWEILDAGENRARRRYYRLTPTGAEVVREKVTLPSPTLRRLRPHPGLGLATRLGLGGAR